MCIIYLEHFLVLARKLLILSKCTPRIPITSFPFHLLRRYVARLLLQRNFELILYFFHYIRLCIPSVERETTQSEYCIRGLELSVSHSLFLCLKLNPFPPQPITKPTASPLYPRMLVDEDPTIPAGISSTGDSTHTRLFGTDAERLRKSREVELKRQLRALKTLQTSRGTGGIRGLRFF